MEEKKIVITIGRQFGSGGREVAKKVAQALEIPYYNKELLAVAAQESGLSDKFLREFDEKPGRSFLYSLVINPQTGINSMVGGKSVEDLAYDAQRNALRLVADQGSCVIVGRGADYILKRDYPVLSVFISGEYEWRIRRIMSRDGMTREQAEKKMAKVDRSRAAFYNGYSEQTWGTAGTYDLCLKMSDRMDSDLIARIIVEAARDRMAQ